MVNYACAFSQSELWEYIDLGSDNLNQTINMYSTIQLTLEHIHVTFEGKAK